MKTPDGKSPFLRRSLLKSRRGAFLVASILFMTPVIGVGILATDIGMAHLVRTEATNAADLVALAAIKKFAKSSGVLNAATMADIRQTAELVGELNRTRNHASVQVTTTPYTGNDIDSSGSDIIFGFFNHETQEFTANEDTEVQSDAPTNAIMARVRIGEGPNDPFTFYLARFLDRYNPAFSEMIMRTEAFASFGYVNVATVVDISASMDNRTYMPPELCRHSTRYSASSRWFHNAAATTTYGPCENIIADLVGGDGIGVNGDYGAVMPEPITSVFEAIYNFYDTNRLFRGLYRSGLVVYETTAYEPYADGRDVALLHHSLGNKDDIMHALDYSINQWQAFAVANGGVAGTADYRALPAFTAFPGGLNPPETTYTNTGDALRLAITRINDANAITRVRSSDNILLITDGLANCFRPDMENPDMLQIPECPRSGALRANVQPLVDAREAELKATYGDPLPSSARDLLNNYRDSLMDAENASYADLGHQWEMANARLAADSGITIHGIYFGVEEVCDENAPPAGYTRLQEVAAETGGTSACANNIADVEDFFEELSTKQSYILVDPQTLTS